MCRTTVTTAATRDKLGLTLDVDEDGGVAEGVVEGVVEPPLFCVGVGGVGAVECPVVGAVGMVELLLRCAVVGDVGVVERSLRCEAVGDVGDVALDDHFHRSINGRPIERQNERVGMTGSKTLSLILPQGPIGPSVEFWAPLGSTSRSIDSWTLSNAPFATHAFGRKSEPRVPRRTRPLRCAAAKAKSLFPSFRVVQLNRSRTGDTPAAKQFRRNARAYNSSLAFTSQGATIDMPFQGGVQVLRINGAPSHQLGPLIPGDGYQPSFAQLHIMDSDYALQRRQEIFPPGRNNAPVLRPGILKVFQNSMVQRNPYVQRFHQAGRPRADQYAVQIEAAAAQGVPLPDDVPDVVLELMLPLVPTKTILVVTTSPPTKTR
jgi:hypothetical protein